MDTLIQASQTSLKWLDKIRSKIEEKIPRVRYRTAKYWASFVGSDTDRAFARLQPQKTQIRLFTTLDLSFDSLLQPTPSTDNWADRFPSIYLIKSEISIDKAVQLIIESYNEDLRG